MAVSDSGFLSTPDLVLSFIPGLLLAAMLAVGVFGVSTHLALAAGSVPAAGAVGYALFWEPPTDGAE
jgi:hypothetical protein